MLDNLDDIIAEVKPFVLERQNHYRATTDRWKSSDKFFCPQCNQDRHAEMCVTMLRGTLLRICRSNPISDRKGHFSTDEFGTSLITMQCLQCETKIACVVYDSKNPSIIKFASRRFRFGTASTPDTVNHYLQEAHKCLNVGANGAAVAMFRVALEQILHDQGYQSGMLDSKIKAVEEDQNKKSGPEWVADIDGELLNVLKKLGNSVLHPKDPNKLKEINDDLVRGLVVVFQHLLYEIYELPSLNKALQSSLQQGKKANP